MPQTAQKARKVLRLSLCVLCLFLASILAAGQTPQRNASKLTVALKITNGALDIDRTQSKFVASDEFRQSLSIPAAEAEQIVFANVADLLKKIPKPYRFALSDADKARDDKGQLDDAKTISTISSNWTDYLQQYDQWTSSTNRTSMPEIFSAFESTALGPLVTAADATALLVWDDGSFDAEQGTFTFTVLDPITKWADEKQVQILFPDLPAGPKQTARRNRIDQLLRPLAGRPRCYECVNVILASFYKRLGLDPVISFDNRNTSPLLITIIESKRIVSISWLSLKDDDPNVEKLMYSLLTDHAFRQFLKKRSSIGKVFNYREQTGQPGPYLNTQRLQIQQLLVTQLGYTASVTRAPGEGVNTSNFSLTIQKLSDLENAEDKPATTNETPESAPATANTEGVVTAHDQEKKTETEFTSDANRDKPKDKKRYVGGGIEYRPGQGVKFFGLAQMSRVPLLPNAVNNVSVKAGGNGDDGVLGSANYFADYVFFNSLHRRLSVQFTVSSDIDANRNLTTPNTDERRRTGLARLELELFRDKSGSLLRFYSEGRIETVELKPDLTTFKGNLNTVEVGAFYFFESVESERPRRIKFEPKFKFGLGLANGEPRYNKLLATGNFHQVLPRRYEFDLNGRTEIASRAAPQFELPSFGGAEVLRGFRRDDGIGRKLWTLQNEVWIPFTIGDDSSIGLKAMVREKIKAAAFVDVGGLYDTTNVKPGTRVGTGLGLRFIYNPIIFKFDFGYGFGEKATSGGRGKFHFGLTSNLPF